MNKILTVSLPLFTMILCGFFIVRLKIIGREMVSGLVSLVFWLFLPFFIFTKTINASKYGTFDWQLLQAYYLAVAFVFFIAALAGYYFIGGNLRIACLRGLTSVSGVVGYMGLPLMVMAFGDRAIVPAVMITIADNLVILAGGALMMEMTGTTSQKNGLHFIKNTLQSIIKNPLILSVILSIIFLAMNIQLPAPVQVLASQMTDATGPLALVALGAALATHSLKKENYSLDAILLAILKVIALPLFVYCTTKYLYDLTDFTVTIAVIMAALPVAVNVFVMASRYQSYEKEISIAMLISVPLGFLVISSMLFLFT